VEAALILGEDTSPAEARQSISSEAVAGYYDPSTDEIVVVGTESLDAATLAHEATHAVQDQQFNLSGDSAVRDRSRARTMVVEGDADAVESRYVDRCGENWSCAGSTGDGLDFDDVVDLSELLVCELLPGCENDGGLDVDRGYLLTFAQPYQLGPEFVEGVHDDGGWDAVNDLHETYPESTEQVIHAEKYPDEGPVNVTLADRSTDEWSPLRPRARGPDARRIDPLRHLRGQRRPERHRELLRGPSAGWAGDALVPYHNGSADADESSESEAYGYVWKLGGTPSRTLRGVRRRVPVDTGRPRQRQRGPERVRRPRVRPLRRRLPRDQDGTTVTIVNAPERPALSEIHAPVDE